MSQVVFVTVLVSRKTLRETEIDVFASEDQARECCRTHMIDCLVEAKDYEDDEDVDIYYDHLVPLSDEELIERAADEDCYCEYRPILVS